MQPVVTVTECCQGRIQKARLGHRHSQGVHWVHVQPLGWRKNGGDLQGKV